MRFHSKTAAARDRVPPREPSLESPVASALEPLVEKPMVMKYEAAPISPPPPIALEREPAAFVRSRSSGGGLLRQYPELIGAGIGLFIGWSLGTSFWHPPVCIVACATLTGIFGRLK